MPHQALQEIVCCLGQPVAGNPTQYMMEKAFVAAGLDWRYLTLEVPADKLTDAVRGLRAMGFRGANFTIPHKVAVIPLLDSLSPAAELMGAVNCVKRDGAKLLGENTDGKGFVQSLRSLLDPSGKRIAILGSGGAARAIAVELGLSGAAEIVIVNRTVGRGQDLVSLLNDKVKVNSRLVHWKGDFEVPAEIDVLINATSIGLGDAQAQVPVDVATLRNELVVADVIFNPPRTKLIRDAEGRGCRTLDGLGMLVNQAVIGFKIWTGVDPDPEVMRDALEEFLNI
ncbi:Shikimate dehydrogenase [Anatilimnocola aggregata]|uniref:Shikimate dehydrogenase (NADP(+)) n=1 Tax=Anatilimnocola aggregata TaxID=2528021 RepID=A0A517YD58_9BACT|nr:shikimate dehydrogenase [Anatilimnocola aggregata]QDU28175.1 Shikimate dehydrogenase [Anatilimnocola aggregata]